MSDPSDEKPTVPNRGRRRRSRFGTLVYRGVLLGSAFLFAATLASVGVFLLVKAWPAITHDGLGLITGTTWDPLHDKFGAFPFIVGTFLTTAVALVFASPSDWAPLSSWRYTRRPGFAPCSRRSSSSLQRSRASSTASADSYCSRRSCSEPSSPRSPSGSASCRSYRRELRSASASSSPASCCSS